MLFDVVVVILPGNSLYDVPCHRSSVVGISWSRARRIYARGQMLFHILSERSEVLGIFDEQLLDRFLEPGSMRHDVAQRNRLGICGWNFEVKVVVHIAVEGELDFLY